MSEAAKFTVDLEAILEEVAQHVAAFEAGSGPNLRAQDVAAIRVAGGDVGIVEAMWDEAKAPLFIWSEPQPKREESEEAQPEPEPKVQLPAVVPPKPKVQHSKAEQQLEALNAEHAVITNFGGRGVIASWDPSSFDPSKMEWAFQSKDSFQLRYSNRYAEVDVRSGIYHVPLGGWWLSHPGRRQFRGVTFRPNGPEVVGECLNLWRGWGVDDVQGDWSFLRDHIENVIAGGNAEFAEYVIRWIAWSIQHPDRQAEVALVLIGEKGTGKGTLVRALERVFGAHAFQVNSREAVIGQFNGHLQDCILFVADEAYWGGDKRCVGRLQGMITEPKLSIERKGIDLFDVPNLLHIVMLAEPGWVIPAGRYERRYAALPVSNNKRSDKAYFKALHRQIAEGGAEAMFYDLKRMDLGDWHPRDIPDTLLRGAALQKQQQLTLPPLEQWYLGLLQDGRLPGIWFGYPSRAYTEDLRKDAKEKFPRLKWDLSDVALANFLKDEVGCEQKRSGSCNGWSFPPLPEARTAWEERYGPRPWDNPEAEWGGKPAKLKLVEPAQPMKRRI